MSILKCFTYRLCTLLLTCLMLNGCSVQHARFQSSVIEPGFQNQKIKDIAVHLTAQNSNRLAGLNSQLESYLQANNISQTSQSNNHLWLECSEVLWQEPRSRYLVETSPVAGEASASRHTYQRIDWKMPGNFLVCNGRFSRQKPLWTFSFSIHEDYLQELPQESLQSLSQMIWYSGEGLINLNTGEVY